MTLSKLYLMASKKAKDVVAEKFQLKQPLYFSFTHLVCRTAMDGECIYGHRCVTVCPLLSTIFICYTTIQVTTA